MDVVVKPLADGGEGTVEALVEGMNGTYEYVTVTDPMGSHVKARYGILPDQTAVMEMAEASGITLVKEPLNPWKAASTGVGEMILDAVQKRMPQIYHWNWRQCDDRGRHRNVIGTGL